VPPNVLGECEPSSASYHRVRGCLVIARTVADAPLRVVHSACGTSLNRGQQDI
jgi:hypothetical protein